MFSKIKLIRRKKLHFIRGNIPIDFAKNKKKKKKNLTNLLSHNPHPHWTAMAEREQEFHWVTRADAMARYEKKCETTPAMCHYYEKWAHFAASKNEARVSTREFEMAHARFEEDYFRGMPRPVRITTEMLSPNRMLDCLWDIKE